ncbi:MAG: YdcH family protein [Zymomonas mobilis subsp. pomaceae]|uniref:DUF465 domain-containing protein n=1 Tax=Zymomonas mobilis subsp. pomaceae (strain ATCC 29192 / DSM 22645 / JCM 10191 / CCUG 17912 / NBRC 13757 / NCIMB 11200 / NRRL B-4491 / Barker I) TaxID=579138 RepID=F8EUH6_ZYMMT|nr:YdcH family protein [Zymomonas mobilis]AEI37192.1 protein of unknown function DUF465 [Zymomonas mobilis subsp. pomaceae ATCC 29192]MDX5948562.1 YdcH family protein [Zymomonas mobilis subsp. pomaceae]GEB88368.1 hypothetical protein ZMO02_00050 [Zymomonas mobilis subsp. pomaceae]
MRNRHLSALFAKHAHIDARLRAEVIRPNPDFTVVSRLKKEKLRIKEDISGIK